MKNILIAMVMMLIASPAFPKAGLINSAVNTIPVAYDATAGSKAVSCAASSELEVYNDTAAIIGVGLAVGTDLPSQEYSIVSDGPGTTRIYKAKAGSNLFGSNTMVYIRSMNGGTISSGNVAITCVL